jgi:hypothetical protein
MTSAESALLYRGAFILPNRTMTTEMVAHERHTTFLTSSCFYKCCEIPTQYGNDAGEQYEKHTTQDW